MAFEDDEPSTGKKIFVGSKTETALLQFAKELGWRNARETHNAASVVQMILSHPSANPWAAAGCIQQRAKCLSMTHPMT